MQRYRNKLNFFYSRQHNLVIKTIHKQVETLTGYSYTLVYFFSTCFPKLLPVIKPHKIRQYGSEGNKNTLNIFSLEEMQLTRTVE